MTTPIVQPNPTAAVQDVRTCILGGDNAVKNATMAGVAVAIAGIALIFFAEIQTFIWSGLILTTIATGTIAIVELAGSQFRGNPTVDSTHRMLDQAVAFAENALVNLRSLFASAVPTVSQSIATLTATTFAQLGNTVAQFETADVPSSDETHQ